MERTCHDAITVRLSNDKKNSTQNERPESFLLTLFSTFLCHRTVSFHVPITFFLSGAVPYCPASSTGSNMVVDGVGGWGEGGGDGRSNSA